MPPGCDCPSIEPFQKRKTLAAFDPIDRKISPVHGEDLAHAGAVCKPEEGGDGKVDVLTGSPATIPAPELAADRQAGTTPPQNQCRPECLSPALGAEMFAQQALAVTCGIFSRRGVGVGPEQVLAQIKNALIKATAILQPYSIDRLTLQAHT